MYTGEKLPNTPWHKDNSMMPQMILVREVGNPVVRRNDFSNNPSVSRYLFFFAPEFKLETFRSCVLRQK